MNSNELVLVFTLRTRCLFKLGGIIYNDISNTTGYNSLQQEQDVKGLEDQNPSHVDQRTSARIRKKPLRLEDYKL